MLEPPLVGKAVSALLLLLALLLLPYARIPTEDALAAAAAARNGNGDAPLLLPLPLSVGDGVREVRSVNPPLLMAMVLAIALPPLLELAVQEAATAAAPSPSANTAETAAGRHAFTVPSADAEKRVDPAQAMDHTGPL